MRRRSAIIAALTALVAVDGSWASRPSGAVELHPVPLARHLRVPELVGARQGRL